MANFEDHPISVETLVFCSILKSIYSSIYSDSGTLGATNQPTASEPDMFSLFGAVLLEARKDRRSNRVGPRLPVAPGWWGWSSGPAAGGGLLGGVCEVGMQKSRVGLIDVYDMYVIYVFI